MKVGAFDHMDRGASPLSVQYEERLKLIEVYDRAGFHAYHLAEHHATPLGMAPSPGVFLAAVAQRTKNLRFGPLVYTLALYHPLRLMEEICMLDQMSGGRFELGVGRGISPVELGYYGADFAASQAVYAEALEIILRGMRGGRLTFEGKHFTFRDVPMEMSPVQRPHPPLWYGLGNPDSVPWTVRNKANVVCAGGAARVRPTADRYRALWAEAGNSPADLPKIAITRHIVVADDSRTAYGLAKRAYKVWYDHLMLLWLQHGLRPQTKFAEDFDELTATGNGYAGTASEVRDALLKDAAASGVNYVVVRLAFGDLSFAESSRSVDLFVREVMPAMSALKAA
jgi:alkanesulfonate monooxygenase SsuD/methylene tetrahydromethanopterin reductase-like flavin-dependent oxidoreductase (luciferase family)